MAKLPQTEESDGLKEAMHLNRQETELLSEETHLCSTQ